MNPPKLTTARHLFALAIALWTPLGLWADPNSIRVINLTGPITNFNGNGINIGEIDPSGVADSAAAGLSGQIALTTNLTVPNSGTLSSHATEVAGVMVTTDQVSLGVAPGARVCSVQAGSLFDFVNAAFWLAERATPVINMSAGSTNPPSNGSDYASRGLDWVVSQYGTIFVQAAGNSGAAGAGSLCQQASAFNVITVGAVNNALPGNTPFVAAYSSRGRTSDGRTKPDIVAPGGSGSVDSPASPPQDNVTMPTSPAGTTQRDAGTSFAAPHVAAVAARLVQAAQAHVFPGNPAHAQDPRVMKAVLLNSATKLAGWTQGGPLMGKATHVTHPLDVNQGAGLLNAAAAYDQYAAGEHAETFHGTPIRTGGPLGLGTDPLEGWHLGSVDMTFDSGLENIYRFEERGGGQLTATLNWYRDVQTGADFTAQGLVNLDLALWSSPSADFSSPTLVAWSRSTADNVEHLFLTDLEFTYYELTVEYAGYGNSTLFPPSESYGLAWTLEPIPEPGTGLLAALGIGLVVWWRLPRRPSQFA